MVSESNASIKLKSWKPSLPPCSADLAFRTVLRKKIDHGSTISFSFDESTLKDPSSKKGAVVSVEKSLTGRFWNWIIYQLSGVFYMSEELIHRYSIIN